jgi:hypothetical protein
MKNPGEMTREEATAETQRFAAAVMDAIHSVCKERGERGESVHLPCLVGAMTGVLAHHLAGIDDQEHRVNVFRQVGQTLADLIEEALLKPGHNATVIDNSKPFN